MSSGPAYGVPSPARPDRLGWPRVLARMLLVVLPAQVVGALVAVLVLELSGALLTLPRADVLIVVAAGLLAGLGLGLLLRPDRDQLVAYAVAGAVLGATVFCLLLGIGRMRGPALSAGPSLWDFLLAAVVVAAVQTAVAVALWWRRVRIRP